VLLVAFDVQAVGALASVTRSEGLLATALDIAPADASGGTRGPSFAATLVSRPSRAVPLRSTAARALAENAMADALPFFEALALGPAGALELPLSRSLALRLAASA